jgi:hypothetical protein
LEIAADMKEVIFGHPAIKVWIMFVIYCQPPNSK